MMVLDLGEIERFLILYMVREVGANTKNRKGRDFGNSGSLPRECGASW